MQWGRLILLALLFFIPLNGGDTLAIHLDKYVVQDGDYLSKIQMDYPGITWEEIYSFNGGTVGDNPNLIHPDSILYIPVESSYIKGETLKTQNYTLQAWALVVLVAVFILIYKKKTPPIPIINVQTARPEISSQEAIKIPTPKTKIGEVKLVGSGSIQDQVSGLEPTELSLLPEKINTRADTKVALDKLREIRK